MTDHRDPHEERLDEFGVDTRAHKRPAGNSTRIWLIGSLAAISLIAVMYGYGQYTATSAFRTASSQVETTGAASTPAPPPSIQGGAR